MPDYNTNDPSLTRNTLLPAESKESNPPNVTEEDSMRVEVITTTILSDTITNEEQDLTNESNSNNLNNQGFFHQRIKRKLITPIPQEGEKEIIGTLSKARHTELYCEPSYDNQHKSILEYKDHVSLFPLHSMITPTLDYEKNLSPDFYQPFLQELFTLLAKDYSATSFIVTGSAAKQLQNSKEKNPNDIDILLKKDDLVEGTAKLKMVLAQMSGVSIACDDHAGTLGINYKDKLFKVQVIDYQTSRHCFPAKQDENKFQNKDAITMLDASVIPQKEESDTEDDLNSEIKIEYSIKY